MNKATRGPWTLTHISGSNFAVQEFGLRGMFGDAPNVYPIFNRNSEAIDGATIYCSPENARLIAAAPELLAAAKKLEEAEAFHLDCEECEGREQPEICGHCFPLYDDARVMRRNAIAKAEPAPMVAEEGTKP